METECDLTVTFLQNNYLIGVEEAQDRYGQLGEEDQRQAEGELEREKTQIDIKPQSERNHQRVSDWSLHMRHMDSAFGLNAI